LASREAALDSDSFPDKMSLALHCASGPRKICGRLQAVLVSEEAGCKFWRREKVVRKTKGKEHNKR
jgi:hypothetical protein